MTQAPNRASPVALATGSTSGIGAAIAQRLSAKGYGVVLHALRSAQTGHAFALALGNAIYVQADLADDADRVRLVREALSWSGRLDVLINNAGVSWVIPMPTSWPRLPLSGKRCMRSASWLRFD